MMGCGDPNRWVDKQKHRWRLATGVSASLGVSRPTKSGIVNGLSLSIREKDDSGGF